MSRSATLGAKLTVPEHRYVRKLAHSYLSCDWLGGGLRRIKCTTVEQKVLKIILDYCRINSWTLATTVVYQIEYVTHIAMQYSHTTVCNPHSNAV